MCHISDHLLQKKIKLNFEKISFIGRSYRLFNKDKFRDELPIKSRLGNVYNMTDPNDCWDYMYNQVLNVLDGMCPVKKFKFAREKPPWMSDDLIEFIKDRVKATKVA